LHTASQTSNTNRRKNDILNKELQEHRPKSDEDLNGFADSRRVHKQVVEQLHSEVRDLKEQLSTSKRNQGSLSTALTTSNLALTQSKEANAQAETTLNTQMAALHTTYTEENAEDKRTITSLKSTITANKEVIDAQLIDIGVSVRKHDQLEEINAGKDLRIAGLITQNDSFLAARRESLEQTKEIKSLKNDLRIAREAYARLCDKYSTLQMTATEERSRTTPPRRQTLVNHSTTK